MNREKELQAEIDRLLAMQSGEWVDYYKATQADVEKAREGRDQLFRLSEVLRIKLEHSQAEIARLRAVAEAAKELIFAFQNFRMSQERIDTLCKLNAALAALKKID